MKSEVIIIFVENIRSPLVLCACTKDAEDLLHEYSFGSKDVFKLQAYNPSEQENLNTTVCVDLSCVAAITMKDWT